MYNSSFSFCITGFREQCANANCAIVQSLSLFLSSFINSTYSNIDIDINRKLCVKRVLHLLAHIHCTRNNNDERRSVCPIKLVKWNSSCAHFTIIYTALRKDTARSSTSIYLFILYIQSLLQIVCIHFIFFFCINGNKNDLISIQIQRF